MNKVINFGVALNITGSDSPSSDKDIVKRHLIFGDMLEPLGFNAIYVFEHHHSGYILSPTPMMLLSYFAGRTEHIKLGTSVLVLPWHNSIRIAESIIALDIFSNGRGIFGFGKGRSVTEAASFGVKQKNTDELFIKNLSEIISLTKSSNLSDRNMSFLRPASSFNLDGRMKAVASKETQIKWMAKNNIGQFYRAQSAIQSYLQYVGFTTRPALKKNHQKLDPLFVQWFIYLIQIH